MVTVAMSVLVLVKVDVWLGLSLLIDLNIIFLLLFVWLAPLAYVAESPIRHTLNICVAFLVGRRGRKLKLAKEPHVFRYAGTNV